MNSAMIPGVDEMMILVDPPVVGRRGLDPCATARKVDHPDILSPSPDVLSDAEATAEA